MRPPDVSAAERLIAHYHESANAARSSVQYAAAPCYRHDTDAERFMLRAVIVALAAARVLQDCGALPAERDIQDRDPDAPFGPADVPLPGCAYIRETETPDPAPVAPLPAQSFTLTAPPETEPETGRLF